MHSVPELIAPAQNWSSLKAVKSLADSIYFGVQKYNMRRKANNFKEEELDDIVSFCHKNRLKCYLCTNILIYDEELRELDNLIENAKAAEVDAIIVHDIAVIKMAKKHGIDFHISTQANISNLEAAKFYEDLGAKKLIVARELSLDQIKYIRENLKQADIECFIHGSMCTSISGRCYFSAVIEGSEQFSANRGNCVQPCRRTWRVFDDMNNEFIYDGKLFLNAKDLCMIEHVPELIQAKIDAFKIEGRMKNPRYIRTVTTCYREAIDSYFSGTYTNIKVEEWKKQLSTVYNRGFHTGFYFNRPDVKDIELTRRGNLSSVKKCYFGKVLSFDVNLKAAKVKIEQSYIPLRDGDLVYIISDKKYQELKIKKIFFEGKKVKKIEKENNENQKKPIIIEIIIEEEVKPEDKIYKYI